LYIDRQANIGYTENAGVIWSGGTWYDADAYDKNLVSTGQAVKDTRFGADRSPGALNTILANTVKILAQETEIDGLATHLSGILHAADIPTGLRIREEAFERRALSRSQYLGARNRSGPQPVPLMGITPLS
jgi:hypothetical protein